MADYYTRIKRLSSLTKISFTKLAEHYNVSVQAMHCRIKIGKLELSGVRELAKFFGAVYHVKFVSKNIDYATGSKKIIYDDNFDTFGEMIEEAIKYRNTNIYKLGKKIGLSWSTVKRKLTISKFNRKELVRYCDALDFEPFDWFELGDKIIE